MCYSLEPSKNEITVTEAVLTISFMAILLGLAFGADKYRAYKLEAEKGEEDKKKDEEN